MHEYHRQMAEISVDEALGDAAEDDYIVMVDRLRVAASAAEAEGDVEEAGDLRAVQEVCYLQATPDLTPPYRAMMVFGEQHSGDLNTLSGDTPERLTRLLPAVRAPLVRGRIADVLWLVSDKGVRFGFARQALTAFLECDFEEGRWFVTGEETARRAIGLAKNLGASGRPFLAGIRDRLSAAALEFNGDSYYVLRVTDVLLQARLGSDRAAEIAGRLQACGDAAGQTGEFQRAVDYVLAASRWWMAAEDPVRAAAAQARAGSLLIDMAVSRGAGANGGSNLVASVVLQNALKALRAVPRHHRAASDVDQRIADVLALLRTAGELSLSEMKAFTSDPIDVSDAAAQAQATVRGKEPLEALGGFCGLLPFADVAAARATVEEQLQEHPLQGLFGTTHFSHDGRITRKVPPLGSVGSAEYEAAVWAQTVKQHGYRVSLVVYGLITPILDVLRDEQILGESEFLHITRRSSVVPPQNEFAFAVGLAAGLQGEWLTAINVLAPQVENMIRQLLKSAGVRTSVVEEDGTENEVGLSALLATEAAEDLCGVDLLYELKAVFTDPLGPNLRNEVAHGLLIDAAAYGPAVVYAWWLVLKIVVTPVVLAMQRPSADA